MDLYEARKRIPDEFQGITFFSEHDVWLYDANPIPTTCVACLELAGSQWLGSDLRGPFQWLEILNNNTIHPWTHPNCRCRFNRLYRFVKLTVGDDVKYPKATKRKFYDVLHKLPQKHVEDVTYFEIKKKIAYGAKGLYDGLTISIQADVLNEPDTAQHIVFHEVGHHVWYDDLTSDDRSEWRRIWFRAPMPTDYAKNAEHHQIEEGFAECYMVYYNNLWKGKKLHLEVERFIKKVKDRRG